jgi:hypothetical protein
VNKIARHAHDHGRITQHAPERESSEEASDGRTTTSEHTLDVSHVGRETGASSPEEPAAPPSSFLNEKDADVEKTPWTTS